MEKPLARYCASRPVAESEGSRLRGECRHRVRDGALEGGHGSCAP